MENSWKVFDEYLGTTAITPATVREKRVALWSSSTRDYTQACNILPFPVPGSLLVTQGKSISEVKCCP